MVIARGDKDVKIYMERILSAGIENPVLIDKYMPGTELEVDVISDGKDVLIPGIMQHIERAGVHSGDSIAVYPPYNITDKMREKIIECSTRLALSLGTQGLVNIQYLIFQNELYVIEVNPRASRTVPYISKVTGVPMVDVAAKVMLGKPLASMGLGTGLYKTPPYFTVKVPVFSFEKLSDANSMLGPEMKSTGEVLGIGKTLSEALFKGISAAGYVIKSPMQTKGAGVFISVDEHDCLEVVALAKKLDDIGMHIYATEDTAAAIAMLGISVETLPPLKDSDAAFKLLESGKISYIVYTGAVRDGTIDDYIALHRKALQLSIPCFTSLDTANALADVIASRFNLDNTELVDITRMRTSRTRLKFSKMEGSGNDYIFINNMDGKITCPESLCISFCDRSRGIGGDGIVLIEKSDIADAKMRIFNKDGSEGKMAGNSIRCVGKYLYDNGIVRRDELDIETASGIKHLKLYTQDGRVSSVCVDMGKADLSASSLPTTLKAERIIDYPVTIGGRGYRITCVSVGNPHCVVFCDRVEGVDIERVGPQFECADIFPERINTEFIRVVNKNTIKMRVYERGNGETMACGTGACAAVVAAAENGYCNKGEDVTVKLRGGDLTVNYTDERILLTGDARLVYEGEIEY
jgi:carbamoyl-phosphate synthase large subunit